MYLLFDELLRMIKDVSLGLAHVRKRHGSNDLNRAGSYAVFLKQ